MDNTYPTATGLNPMIKPDTINVFKTLNAINVNDHVEKKKDLSYLSWAWAWAEVKKVYPSATYDIKRFENNLPYVFDEKTGYMVFTTVTIEGITHEMWLPVMDANNKAMKDKPYTYDTYSKKGIVVEAATMFDINKTIMRCLTKNLAMFGLGLYIYAGEDLPEESDVVHENPDPIKPSTLKAMEDLGINIEAVAKYLKKSAFDITDAEMLEIIKRKRGGK